MALACGLGACGSSGHKTVTPPTATTTTTTTAAVSSTTTTIAPGAQVSGPRTVLSPVGLNVRAHAATTAAVLATAAQGTVLTVLGNSGHGWLLVKGATHTGWISDSASLSAPGKFSAYTSTSNQFDALYPLGWTYSETPPATVVFREASGPDTVVVTTAASTAALGPGRSGYHQTQSEQIVVCGVTTHLDTYTATTAPRGAAGPGATAQRYLAQVRVPLDATHALGIDANLADLTALPTVRNFANSVTFPFPQCEG